MQADATGAGAASYIPHEVCVHSCAASEFQAKHQRDGSPNEEEEERCDEGDEGPVRSAPLELLAEVRYLNRRVTLFHIHSHFKEMFPGRTAAFISLPDCCR